MEKFASEERCLFFHLRLMKVVVVSVNPEAYHSPPYHAPTFYSGHDDADDDFNLLFLIHEATLFPFHCEFQYLLSLSGDEIFPESLSLSPC